MSQIGAYRVVGRLGEGAMGVVYRAVGASGTPVALKTVTVDGIPEVQALRREISALARLHHPGISRILDHGVHEGRPWVAMELVEGDSLGAVARKLTGGSAGSARTSHDTWHGTDAGNMTYNPVSPPARDERPPAAGGQLVAALSLIRALCDPLAWLHGEGVVHRDLKPSNVMVVDGVRPVLVDFGLAALFSAGRRERLRVERHRAGTVAYMAPEQIRGESVDARADLYALGCMLYELLCGRPPFVSESTVAVMQGHLGSQAVPCDARVAGLSSELDELVMTLLAKDPGGRIGYADLVAAQLEELGATAPERTGPKARPYLYSGRFAGRERDVERLEALLDRNGLAMLGAESGGGKTRVALEIAARRRDKVHIEVAECVPVGTEAGADGHGGPLYPFASIFRSVGDAIRGGAELLDEQTDALRPFLPGLADDPQSAQGGAAHRVLKALSVLLGRLGGERGCLVIVDDLQWADGLTLEWIGLVARSRPPGLRVLGTYRVDEVGEILADVLEDCGDGVVALPTLDEEAVGAMVRDMLALSDAPVDFVRFLTRTAVGNPFFVSEYLRTAIAEGLLFRDDRGRWHVLSDEDEEARPEHFDQMALPDSLAAVVGRRLTGLSPGALKVAGFLATLGREASLDLLEGSSPGASDAAAELVGSRVCEESGGRLRFLHDKLREAAYAAVPTRRRPGVHRQVAEALQRGDGDLDELASAIAYHLERGDRPSEARSWYLRAAREAETRHALRDAARLYEAGLSLPSIDDEAAVEARVAWARAARITGAYPVAIAVAQETVTQALAADLTAWASRALRELAAARIDGGSLDDALTALEQAVKLGPSHGDGVEWARAELALGGVHREKGRLDRAMVAYARAGELAPGDREVAQARLSGEARVHYTRGEHAISLSTYDQALAIAMRRRDVVAMAGAHNGRANGLAALGRHDEAMEAYEASRECNERVGNPNGAAVSLANQAIQYQKQGDVAEAERRHGRALEIFREIGSWRYCGHALVLMARYARLLGRPAEAAERAREAADFLRRVGDEVWLADALEEVALAEALQA